MIGLTILLGFNLLGIALHQYAHIPLPANVIALILFTASLFAKLVKIEWVEHSAQLLLKNMSLFFVPIIVGVINFFPILHQYWLSIGVSLIGSTLVVLYTTGLVTTWILRAKGEKTHEH